MTEKHDSSARKTRARGEFEGRSPSNENERRPAKRSERSCAGCSKAAAAEDLVRVILDPSTGEVAVDLAGSGFGRGAHLHAAPECVAKSLKGGLARVFKTKVVADASAIGADIVKAADRRIEGLLAGARRAGQLAVGSDVVVQSMKEQKAELVVVARDARAATRLPEIERAIAAGKAIAFGDKEQLGLLTGRSAERSAEVAVLAILHAGVAEAVSRAYRMSGPFRTAVNSDMQVTGRVGMSSSDAHVESTDRSEEAWSSSPEVR